MNPDRVHIDRLCDSYLDGELSASESNGFQLRLVRDAGLASAVYAHSRIADSLADQMVVPDLSELTATIDALAAEQEIPAVADSHSGRDAEPAFPAITRTRKICMAALAAALMVVCWFFGAASAGGDQSAAQIQLAESWSTSLADVVAGAAAVLATGATLRKDRRGSWRLDGFGTSLLLPSEPIGVYPPAGIPSAATLLFADGHALVVMPKEDDPRPRFTDCRPRLPFRFFRRAFESLVVYEATHGGPSELLQGVGEQR